MTDMVASAVIVLQHERTHIDQFRQTGRRRTAAKMLDDEIAAYGATPRTHSRRP
jgi:hypothetical protein